MSQSLWERGLTNILCFHNVCVCVCFYRSGVTTYLQGSLVQHPRRNVKCAFNSRQLTGWIRRSKHPNNSKSSKIDMSKLLAKIYSFFFPLWRRLLNRPRWFSRLKMKSRLIGPAGINPTYGLISSGQTGLLTPSCSWLVWFELVDKVSGNLLRACHDGLQSCSWRICAIVCQHVMLQECEFVLQKDKSKK